MRKLIVLAVLAGAAILPSAAQAQQNIYIINQSTNVSAAQVADALPAFQRSIDEGLGPVWNVSARLIYQAQSPPKGSWKLYLRDDTGISDAAGFHDVTTQKVPFGVVGTNIGMDWEIIFTHELDEMLVDPYIDRLSTKIGSNTQYFVEVSDPVETQSSWLLSTSGEHVTISDFATPAWYTGGPGPKDWLNLVKHAHQVLPGGYAWKVVNGKWTPGDKDRW